jgi:hypothetical protein
MRQNRLMMRGLFAIAAAARLLYVGAASSAIRFGRRFLGGFAPPAGVQPDVPPAKRFIKSFDGRPRYLPACRASR